MKTESSIKTQILNTGNDNRIIFIRLIVGLIFISEGIQKYLFLEMLGPGRFLEFGFSNPRFWAYFTGASEIFCGILILFGLLTRLATIPLLTIMITAFITTKLPLLTTKGFWTFAHEYRTDFSLTLLLILLVIYGGGKWSLDKRLVKEEWSDIRVALFIAELVGINQFNDRINHKTLIIDSTAALRLINFIIKLTANSVTLGNKCLLPISGVRYA